MHPRHGLPRCVRHRRRRELLFERGRASAAISPILPSASAAFRRTSEFRWPRERTKAGIAPSADSPICPKSFRCEGTDPVVLICRARIRAGNSNRRRRFSDLAQRLHGLGTHPVVVVCHRLDQSGGGLLGRGADGPESLGRLGAHDVVRRYRAPEPKRLVAAWSSGPTCAMASAAAVRTDSSRPARAGQAPGPRRQRPAASPQRPRRRRLDGCTAVLQKLDQCGNRSLRFRSPTAPRDVAAWQRTVSSDSVNKRSVEGPPRPRPARSDPAP